MPIWHPKARHQCADCGVWEGQLHRDGCTLEECPMPGCRWLRHQCAIAEHRDLRPQVFFLYPVLCARCGSTFPPLFHVDNTVWRSVVGGKRREITLCNGCFRWMRHTLTHARKEEGDA